MTSCITVAASLVEPGLDVLFDYKFRSSSSNRYSAKMPTRTHLIPTLVHVALTLTYCSLRSSRRSIRNGCKKVRKRVSMYFENVTHWKIGRREQRKGYSKQWNASCGRIV